MADEPVEKTELEKSRDVINQLKEMQHYAKSNIERLTDIWLRLDGELKQKALATKVEPLITEQNNFHDALEKLIGDYEEVCSGMDDGEPAEG
ncbi:MAG TPA: hypothetical protein DCY13_05015 [Verrucomicrobiales bacterium]|jgi:hypothetical protein|nr:hypothetical protein [Verrucomicrobiales bacterium]